MFILSWIKNGFTKLKKYIEETTKNPSIIYPDEDALKILFKLYYADYDEYMKI